MAKAESKTILKAYSTVESKLPTLPLEDGQLIFVYDKKKIILDNHGVRTVYEQIQTIETEEQRNDLLAPIDSFYFVIETSILWRYTNGHWNQITTSPQEQIDRIATEGTKQVKAVQDKGAEVLQSIPEDFATQMETKLNKQQGIENKGKVLVIGEDGNVVPEEVASGGGDGIAIINTMSGESPLVIPDSAERVNKRLELGGKTEQVQTTGKNLIDYKKIVVGLLNFADGTFSGIYHTYFTTDFIEIESGDYVISHNSNAGIQSYALYDINNKTYVSGKDGNNKVNVLNKCLIRISFNTKPETDVSSNPIDYAKKCNIQLENGTTATSYEPYTGGKPSPSPEYPQQIKSVGKWNEEKQKYEVDVKVSNKNLFDLKRIKNGFVKSTGNSFDIVEDNMYPKSIYLDIIIPLKAGQTLNISGVEQDACRIRVKHDTGNYYLKYTANKDTEIIICFYGGLTDENKKTILIEISDTPTNYEPYKEQTLTLTSDRPITKWDRLVEQGGEIGWLYGSKIIDSYNSEPIDTEYMSSTGSLTVGATVLYKLKNAEFIPLPQSEQNAIRALKTYYPTTVITADGGELDPDIKVTYTADTKNYIDGKIGAINKALLNTQKVLL